MEEKNITVSREFGNSFSLEDFSEHLKEFLNGCGYMVKSVEFNREEENDDE